MSEFQKKEIHFHKDQYEAVLSKLNFKIPFYQDIIDAYNKLEIQSKLQKEDLKELLENTREFLAKKIMNGEEMKVGSLKISSSALFDMIEKPENYNDFVSYVERQINSIEAKENYVWQVNQYCIDASGKTVILRPEKVNEYKEMSTVYIKSQDQQDAYDLLTEIALKLNQLKNLKPSFQESRTIENYLFFPSNLNDLNSKITVNPVSIDRF